MQDLPEIEVMDIIEMTADVVSAYVSSNSVPTADLAELINSVHHTLINLGTPAKPAAESILRATSALIRKSITPDALISFEDGKPYKTLRRHLTVRGLTPESYRAKYGLPADYPMTSARYSAQRSELARNLGLGRQRDKYAKGVEPKLTDSKAPKRRGRPSKAV